jgi:hypothetical protein
MSRLQMFCKNRLIVVNFFSIVKFSMGRGWMALKVIFLLKNSSKVSISLSKHCVNFFLKKKKIVLDCDNIIFFVLKLRILIVNTTYSLPIYGFFFFLIE